MQESIKDTDTTEWIEKHNPNLVSFSLNLVKERIFICNCDPHHLFTSFIGAIENVALQSKAIVKKLLFDMKKTLKIKLGSIIEKLTQRHIR